MIQWGKKACGVSVLMWEVLLPTSLVGRRGVRTTKGVVQAPLVVIAAGGHSPKVALLAGVQLPAKTYPLEAFVTEPLKPLLDPAAVCLDAP